MIQLARARHISNMVVETLAPLCERVEVAGSIRRQVSHVGDIDLVIIPRDLAEVQARCRRHSAVVREGPQNSTYTLPGGHQLDIFVAHAGSQDLLSSTPSNWGSVLLCRTGSKEHNIYLVQRAKSLGLTWKPLIGVVGPDGLILASETEEDIFCALQLDCVAPDLRA